MSRRGHQVHLLDIDEEAVAGLANELGVADPIQGDVADSAVTGGAAASIGSVDLLCLNAGVVGSSTGAAWEALPAEWDRVLGINLFGVVNGLRAFVAPHAGTAVAEPDHHHCVTGRGRRPGRVAAHTLRRSMFRYRRRPPQGDVFDSDAVGAALAETDGAIVCLGSSGLGDKTTLARGTKLIVDAAVERGADRLVVLSAAGVGDSWSQIRWSSRLLFRTMLREQSPGDFHHR